MFLANLQKNVSVFNVGEVSEWSNVPLSKSGRPQGLEGSNPSLSARLPSLNRMTDVFSKAKRSEVMSLIRSKNTKPELALRKLVSAALYPKGYRYRLHYEKLPGKPDIAFVSKRVAVFVDGSFWHGHRYKKGQTNLSRSYWLPKIKHNMERDKVINRALRKIGWRVVRVWEHDIRKNPKKALSAVMYALKGRL